jgi:hypothetical protein
VEASQFDRLVRSMAPRASRRGMFSVLLGGLLAPLLPHEESDARRGKRRHKSRGNRDERRGDGKRRNTPRKRRSGTDRSSVLDEAACYPGTTCTVGNRRNLARCDFGGSSALKGRSCQSCNLSGVNLRRADASGAKLRGANLGGACLVDATLAGADVSGANTTGAIFCRTTMPNGTINNSGCGKSSRCCPTCVAIGSSGCTLGGSCCGGGSCNGGTCVCPPDRPRNCNGVCQACCGDADCASGVCCGGVCCGTGAVCNTRAEPDVCCMPEARERTCPEGSCGRVLNNCGQSVPCGECPVETCVAGACNARNRCEQTPEANGRPGTNCPNPRVCCNSGCCDPGAVCDARGAVPVCCAPLTTCPANACGVIGDGCGGGINCGACTDPARPICTGNTCLPCQNDVECGAEMRCCGGACVAGGCCDAADCPDETCKIKSCTNNQCAYTNVADGTDDPRGQCLFLQVCIGGACGCTRPSQCPGPGSFCCNNRCGIGECCASAADCPRVACRNAVCSNNRCGYLIAADGTDPGGLCPGDEVCCDGGCVDRDTSNSHCGSCNNACTSPDTCTNGTCRFGRP